MKTTIKILMLLLSINLFIGCAAGTLATEAFVKANCPWIKEDYNINNTDTGSRLPAIKKTVQNNDTESEFFLSYSVGVGAEVPINDKFSFNPAVALSGKGNKTSNVGFEDKITSTYIDVPLLISYKLGESKFNLNAGLQPSILLNAKRKITGNGNEDSQKITDQFNAFDLAASLGAGYHFNNGFGLNVGYDHGLININKSDDDFGSSLKAHNRALRFGVSYIFSKNK